MTKPRDWSWAATTVYVVVALLTACFASSFDVVQNIAGQYEVIPPLSLFVAFVGWILMMAWLDVRLDKKQKQYQAWQLHEYRMKEWSVVGVPSNAEAIRRDDENHNVAGDDRGVI